MKDIKKTLIENAFLGAQKAFIRIPIFIEGNKNFVLSLLNQIELVTLISNEKLIDKTILWCHAKRWLGQELDSIFFDLQDEFDVEKLCALIGCIKGGSLVFFWLPKDFKYSQSHFIQRFSRFISKRQCGFISSSGYHKFPELHYNENHLIFTLPTQDQLKAIKSIEKVLYGHRRRPAFILADRGRGKSAALGIAASNIMMAAKKNILVTSPIFSNVETLFKHCALNCELTSHSSHCLVLNNGSQLNFIAPDRLLSENPLCDLLLVDEAAAIPIPILNQIVTNCSRVVFSSTEHGYEGTGRGFSSKFRYLLNKKVTNWQEIRLNQPIRFAKNCPLERWLYDVFLFDVEPFVPKKGDMDFHQITQKQLLKDENLLKQLFALLISAHYQTSPNDLLLFLDNEKSIFVGAFVNGVLVGILYAQQEGGFEQELASEIALGKRRVKGHLLPQSLAQHTGIQDMLSKPILRIVRLAVLPFWRRKKIASQLIKYIESVCNENKIYMMGTSFSADGHLIQFWINQAFYPIRLGVQRDASSGNFSLQLLKSLAQKPDWQNNLEQIFVQNFHYQLSGLYKYMITDAAYLLFSVTLKPTSISKAILLQVECFAHGQLGSDLVSGSLYNWYCYWLAKNQSLICDYRAKLFFSRFVQRHSWQELAKKYGFSGRKEIERQMQLWVKMQLTGSNQN